jgi:chorismate mutase/prephenate dehydrogenase
MSELDVLRAQMAEVDRQIVQALARRLELAASIGEAKRKAGLPLRDWDVERRVLTRASELASSLHVPPDVVRTVMQALIEAARVEQERRTFAAYDGPAERIAIVGGQGKMGRWFTDFFTNQGHRVTSWDVRDERRAALCDALNGADFALLATPLDSTPDVIREFATIGFRGIAFDVASLKSHLKPAIAAARANGLRFCSIHPMFGPGARTLSDKVICVCDCGDAEATGRVAGFFRDTAATLVTLSLEEHDEVMSYVLGLSHIINIIFAGVLSSGGRSFESLNRIGSTTFHSQMITTATVIRENPELYYFIQRLNPFTPQVARRLREVTERLTSEVESGQREAFVEQMRAGQRWMDAP